MKEVNIESNVVEEPTVGQLELSIDIISTFSLAAQQNSYPILKSIRVSYPKHDKRPLRPLSSLKIKLAAIEEWLGEEIWHIDRLEPGQSINIKLKELRFPFEKLFGITEQITHILSFSVLDEQNVLVEQHPKLEILPANFWGGEERQPALLAAFVKPNGVYVESLVRQCALALEKGGYGRIVDGYQSNTREKPYLMLAALWNVVFKEKLAYVSPSQGFAKTGQRIRLASDISNSRMVACLDSSLLFASCIEAMGLNPVVAVTKGHAFVGAWLIDEKLPILTNDDPQDIRKRVDNRDLVLFETTLVSNDSPVTFEQAKDHARELLAEENESEFVMVIDIAQARAQSIKPLSTVEEAKEERTSEGNSEELALPVIPPLPPVRKDEQVVVEETPETRIDSWSRKLLDLTKKNSLLNFSDRAVAIKLYCPNIAVMEDMLADGTKFKFLSAQESPQFDPSRDSEMFRLQTGSDVHREYALNQIKNKVLIANQPAKKLEKNSVELFRRAKNDLEEGGSNTLFLALGFLKWKENPEDSRSYKAPLLLIPVKLTRRSARAPVYVEQLQEEDPIFNLTLIEFLQSEHDINLIEFKDELPEDDSGVDVPFVWQRVREAVKEQPGFELVEELVLGSFSFAKYLMWRDLRDRLDDLKKNPFVQHLVDNPREPYPQVSSFVNREEIDDKLDPAEIYTPLNCDSSQLVAVDASAKAQDFVLEGPPGTGKSETIANIIAHNIGKGRKVLFVAEKMAALNVVYRRLQKVGLDHLCLELHSNKANKRAVLDQLNNAWHKREGLNPRTWEAIVADLKLKKGKLNNYVRALHRKSEFGVSPRDAISSIALNLDSLKIKLDWPLDLAGAPIKSESELDSTQELVEQLALAFSDVRDLDIDAFRFVKATEWSNVWQSKLLMSVDDWQQKFKATEKSLAELLPQFLLESMDQTIANLIALKNVDYLAKLATKQDIAFAIDIGAKERVELIHELASLKAEFDNSLDGISHGVNSENVSKVPVQQWKQFAQEAESGWLKAFFNKRKIDKEAASLGITKITDLSIIDKIDLCQKQKSDIESKLAYVEKYSIWEGWTTTSESLLEKAEVGSEVRRRISELVILTDDPTEILIPVKKWFVDGREFLEESKVFATANAYLKALDAFLGANTALSEIGVAISGDESLNVVSQSLGDINANANKLKNWCEWQSAKARAVSVNLEVLSSALESGSLNHGELGQQFRSAFCYWLAPLLIDADHELRQFKASTHEQTIEAFKKLDERVAQITSDYVIALASEGKPVK